MLFHTSANTVPEPVPVRTAASGTKASSGTLLEHVQAVWRTHASPWNFSTGTKASSGTLLERSKAVHHWFVPDVPDVPEEFQHFLFLDLRRKMARSGPDAAAL